MRAVDGCTLGNRDILKPQAFIIRSSISGIVPEPNVAPVRIHLPGIRPRVLKGVVVP